MDKPGEIFGCSWNDLYFFTELLKHFCTQYISNHTRTRIVTVRNKKVVFDIEWRMDFFHTMDIPRINKNFQSSTKVRSEILRSTKNSWLSYRKSNTNRRIDELVHIIYPWIWTITTKPTFRFASFGSCFSPSIISFCPKQRSRDLRYLHGTTLLQQTQWCIEPRNT